MTPLQQSLLRLGFTDKEVAVYLALLTVGTAPASALANRVKLPKSTTLYTCQQLQKKGLVQMVRKQNLYLCTAEQPEKILLELENQKKNLEQQQDEAKKIMGELRGMMNPHGQLPMVSYYEGRDGLIQLYAKILEINQPICSFEEKGELAALFKDYTDEFVQNRVSRNISKRCIAPKGGPLNVTNPEKLLKVRYVDPAKYPFTCDVKICGDQISIFSFKPDAPVGIAIVHADIAQHFRLMFECMWNLLTEQDHA